MQSAFAVRLEQALNDEAGRLVVADAPRPEYMDAVEWLLRRFTDAGEPAGGDRTSPDDLTGVAQSGSPQVSAFAPPLSFREVDRGPLPGAAPDPIPALEVAERLGVQVTPVRDVPAHVGAVTLVVLDADNLLEAWQRELFRRAGGDTRIVLLGCSARPGNRPLTFLDTMERFAEVPFARIVRGAGDE